MRLINAAKYTSTGIWELKGFPEDEFPEYCILSHRWGPADSEVTYQELIDGELFWKKQTQHKTGYRKIQYACRTTRDYQKDWLWCDTCCIDKTSSAELSEAINSMYRWYQNSSLCIAYLADYPSEKVPRFDKSEWFERAWTLQELIAPPKVVFFDKDWSPSFGKKHDDHMVDAIARRTRIDKQALLSERRLEKFSVAQRMSWAADRKATRSEDIAYSLLGIFDVNMPMLYGEGRKAFVRLQEEIMQRNADQSIFVWSSEKQTRSIFASSPTDFARCGAVQQYGRKKQAFALNNLGLDIHVTYWPVGLNTYMAALAVEDGNTHNTTHLMLEIDPETGYLCRVGSEVGSSLSGSMGDGPMFWQKTRVTMLRQITNKYPSCSEALFGFRLADDCLPLKLINNWHPDHVWDRGRWQLRTKPDPRKPSADSLYFEIPRNVQGSIAMMTFRIGNYAYLIQLAFDFDFNPACCVSKMALDFYQRFRRRSPEQEHTQYRWADRTFETNGPFYLEAQFDDPVTSDPCWIAKAIDRLPFKAQIDPAIIKPRRDNNFSRYEISFHFNPPDRDWYFGLKKAFTGVVAPVEDTPKTRCIASDFPIIDARTHRSDGGTK